MKRAAFAIAVASLPCLAFSAEITVLDQLKEGGVSLLVILGLSILFVTVAIERFVHLRRRTVLAPDVFAHAQSLWNAGRFEELEKMLGDDESTMSRVMGRMLEHRLQPYEVVSRLAGDVASMELRRHQQKAYALAIVATVAPIVGLLGTVLGMIEAFHVIAYSEGMGNPALLAGGISKALVNTAAGLAVALPALGMHHYFKHRLATLGLALEKEINTLINRHFLPALETQPLKVAPHAH
jgi:biopolymer transport protein ExbB